MSDRPSSDHLIERAARRLQENNDDVAAVLLNDAAPGLRRGPASDQHSPGSLLNAGSLLNEPRAPVRPGTARPAPIDPPDFARPQSTHSGAPLDAETMARAGMIDWKATRERLSEEFRIVQAQVLQAIAAKPAKEPALGNLIMLTSARPGEGKTFSSMNLAGSLASCGQQPVILVDVDIKRHSLTTGMSLQNRSGLLNLASQPGLHFSDCLIDTAIPNLSIIPIGQATSGDAMVSGKPIIRVLDRLARNYPDCIIVLDTPPCLSSSEPSTLAPVVGHIVMLIEAQQTQRAEVEAALDLVEACPSVVLMLNKVQMTGSDTFGAYGY